MAGPKRPIRQFFEGEDGAPVREQANVFLGVGSYVVTEREASRVGHVRP